MLFGWLVDFCSIRDDTQPVRGLIDTTPSVIAVIIHWFFNVLPRYFHLIWFAQGATSLGHTELSMTMGWVGQFSVSGNIFMSQFIRITALNALSNLSAMWFKFNLSAADTMSQAEIKVQHIEFLSIHMEMLNNNFLQDLCLLAKMVDPRNLLPVYSVAMLCLEYLGAYSRHGKKGDWQV